MLKRLTTIISKRNFSAFPKKLVEEIVDKKLAEKLDPIGIALKLINENIDSKFSYLDNKIDASDKRRVAEFTRNQLAFNELRHALGRGLDALCRAGLERHFDLSEIEHSEVFRGFKIKDQEGEVHGATKSEIELDVFCEEPLTILECTSILRKEDGAEKLQKFANKKAFVEKKFGKPSQAFFAVIAIQEGFLNSAVKFCKKHEIELIDAKYEFPEQKWEAKNK